MKSVVRLVVSIAVLALALSLGAINAAADSGHSEYEYLVGSGELCGLAPAACPDVAMAPNGDTIEIAGAGTLGIHPKTVTGGGSFVHKHGTTVLGSGTWAATELLSFHSYGSGAVQGLPAAFAGGQALIRVHLSPAAGGSGFDAILTIHCLLGDHIPAGFDEGVRLSVQGVNLNFNKVVSGLTVFIRQ